MNHTQNCKLTFQKELFFAKASETMIKLLKILEMTYLKFLVDKSRDVSKKEQIK